MRQEGEVNCAARAGGAVKAMTGEDPLESISAKTPEELKLWVVNSGYKSVEDALGHYLTRVEPYEAMVGDVALIKGRDPMLGVVVGADVQVMMPNGVVGIVSVERVKAVFRP